MLGKLWLWLVHSEPGSVYNKASKTHLGCLWEIRFSRVDSDGIVELIEPMHFEQRTPEKVFQLKGAVMRNGKPPTTKRPAEIVLAIETALTRAFPLHHHSMATVTCQGTFMRKERRPSFIPALEERTLEDSPGIVESWHGRQSAATGSGSVLHRFASPEHRPMK